MIITDLKNEKVGFCASGGLDSRTIARKFSDMGIKLVCFSADLAQPDEKNINDIKKRMAPCGVETVIVDLKKDMAEGCFDVIKAQAMYDGGYWNSTAIARAMTVRGLLPEMKKRGCTVLAHGATGRGNDQVRFERYTNVLSPDMQVYAPWRDPGMLAEFPGRAEMVAYLGRCGIKVFKGKAKRYSTDANLAGLSHEAGDLESMKTPCTIVEPTMGVWPKDAPDKAELFSVTFSKGRAVKINNAPATPLQAMLKANRIGGRNGIGMKNALENRVIGTKSRGVYEAPGMELLGRCLEFVYQAVLNRRSTLLFRQMSALLAGQVYDGRWFDPETIAAMAAVNELAGFASGTVRVNLYKGNIHFHGLINCSASLYREQDASMEKSEGLNPVNSQGFMEIQAVEARTLARASQIRR